MEFTNIESLPTPPGPIKPVNLEFLFGKKLHINFENIRKQYGPVATLTYKDSETQAYIILISGYDNIYHTLVTRSLEFSSRPVQYPNIILNPKRLGIADAESSASWKKQRQFFMVSLMKLGVGKQIFEDCVRDESKELMKTFLWTKAKPYGTEDLIPFAVYNVVHQLLFGFRYKHNDKKYIQIMEGIGEIFDQFNKLFTSLLGSEKKLKKSSEKLINYINQQIDLHASTLDRGNPRDYTDMYLVEMEKMDAVENGFTREELVMQLFDFYGAAIETITTTMLWTLLYLTNRPELQERLYSEIISEVAEGEVVRLSHQQRLPLVCATLLEVQRKASVAASTPPHRHINKSGTIELLGYRIPHDAEIVANLYSIHHDPELFPNPEELIPERHLDADNNVLHNKHILPFSIGSRSCVGMKIAKIEMFIFLTELIRNFKFTSPNGKKLNEDGEFVDVLAPKEFKLICTPRLKG